MVNIIESQVESDGGAGVEFFEYMDGRDAGKFGVRVWALEGSDRVTLLPIRIRQSREIAQADYLTLTEAA